jgi:hypothetical protein
MSRSNPLENFGRGTTAAVRGKGGGGGQGGGGERDGVGGGAGGEVGEIGERRNRHAVQIYADPAVSGSI